MFLKLYFRRLGFGLDHSLPKGKQRYIEIKRKTTITTKQNETDIHVMSPVIKYIAVHHLFLSIEYFINADVLKTKRLANKTIHALAKW